MNYQQTLNYLYDTLPMFSRMGSAALKKDLANTILLCESLGNPQRKFKSIHVGGTNGKGSVSHMLAAVLQTAGYKTGLYTSPHLYDFRERIRVNGMVAEESFVIDFVERIKPLIPGIGPSFFEITVAMAFEYFAQQEVDIAVIEVGLGGRLDSTNIIRPELSVITNIGWDHMNILGNSLEEIAREKAGIIKPGIPVVIGERQPGIDSVFEETALAKQAALSFASDDYEPVSWRWHQDRFRISVLEKDKEKISNWETDLQGLYQLKNICTVLRSREQLSMLGFPVTEEQFDTGIKNVKKLTGLMGRWEIIHKNPHVVLEVAHNRDGIEKMLQHVALLSYGRLHFVFGMVKDKEPDLVLRLLPRDAVYYFTQAQIPRALDAAELKAKAAVHALHGDVYGSVDEALQAAMANASRDDLIIVCGSIFLVAEVSRESVIQPT